MQTQRRRCCSQQAQPVQTQRPLLRCLQHLRLRTTRTGLDPRPARQRLLPEAPPRPLSASSLVLLESSEGRGKKQQFEIEE
jgi:hypothetical protein